MRQRVHKLEFLCLEIIGKYILKFSNVKQEDWKIRYGFNLGERLILAALSNSFKGFDEKSYDFILNNFKVHELKLYPKILKKIGFFDFLNGKSFEKLEICLEEKMELKDRDFRMATNQLEIIFLGDEKFDMDTFKIFSNTRVHRELRIFSLNYDRQSLAHQENIVLMLIFNSSKSFQSLEIDMNFTSGFFRENLLEAVRRKKNLKNVRLSFFFEYSGKCLVNLFKNSLANLSCFSILDFHRRININVINEYLKALSSLENLVIWFCSYKLAHEVDDVKMMYQILKVKHSKSLKKLELCLPAIEKIDIEASLFLENCQNLEKVTITDKRVLKTLHNMFDSLIPSAQNLRVLELNGFNFFSMDEMKSLINLLSQTYLQELTLKSLQFHEGLFFEFCIGIQELKHHLISIEISDCLIPVEDLRFFPLMFQGFHQLEAVYLQELGLDEDITMKILKSLHLANKTLRRIAIGDKNYDYFLQSPDELFKLLNNCENMITIKINFLLSEDRIGELLLILEKFKDSLQEIDLTFLNGYNEVHELMYFLSRFSKLKKIYGLEFVCRQYLLAALRSLENSKYTLKKLNFYELGMEGLPFKFPNYLFS